MPKANATKTVTATERTRVNFGKIPETMELPNLISVQKESFERFKDEGLRDAFRESSPIQSQNHQLEVTFGHHQFGDPSHSVDECREKDMTYQAPLLTEVRLTNKETGEIKEQLVFMGDFPMMTDQGTFIINGTERIVVSQLVRSPGVYYSSEMDGGKQVYKAQIIPARGAWLEFEVDKRDQLVVSIDRKRKQSATMFLRAWASLSPTTTSSSCWATPTSSSAPSSATPPLPARTPSSRSIVACAPASRRPSTPPVASSRACCSTRSATISLASVATKSTRSSASPPRKRSPSLPTRTSSRLCATC